MRGKNGLETRINTGSQRSGVEMVSRPLRALTHIQPQRFLQDSSSRNGVPPVEGIDTVYIFFHLIFLSCRNGVPPVEGIDTSLDVEEPSFGDHGRNGVPPVEGIDTLFDYSRLCESVVRRNGVPPVEGIDTYMIFVTIT